ELGERVVARFVAQLVQQFHAHESTVAPFGAERGGPLEAVDLEQDAAAVVDGRPPAEAGDAVEGPFAQAVDAHDEDAARRRLGMAKAKVQRAKAVAASRLRLAERAAEAGAGGDAAADAVRAAEQRRGGGHVAAGKRGAHRRARDALAVHLVAHHSRDVETVARAGGVERRVVAGALDAVAKVVADKD